MKILKVSTNRGGGASKAADRQAKALRAQDCEVKHLFVKQDWNETSIKIWEEGTDAFVSAPMADFIKNDLLFQSYLQNNRTTISNTYMSLWRQESPFDDAIYNYVKDEQFEVVHFHWVANMISSRLLELLSELNVSFAFTGHDMNHFTGGCHYDAQCGEHANECSNCPLVEKDTFNLINKCHAEKTRAMTEAKPRFIYPSNWLNDEHQKSKVGQLLGADSSLVLRNCVDIDYFAIPSKSEVAEKRSKLGFEQDEIIVISGAHNNNEIRKGFEHFEYAVKKINQQRFGANSDLKISFVAFGGGDHVVECTHPKIRYRHLGFINESKVRDLFQVADLLAFTSLEENFANIILESLMCATPVLGFNIGGVPDIVEDEVNGKLIKSVDSENFTKGLSKLLLGSDLQELKKKTEHWSRVNRRKYSEPVIANELIDFYKELRA
ncbi:glycosyltransferase [Idiomarina sp.]|uniref:glycosyltransferase n=1 Tax=Idiomarina sp. TaxID=1874361 RepID=UPI00261CD206|nr:glycosyltransferase [Idiomarina sp.]